VENGNVEALTATLLKMMKDDHLRHSMATAGVRNVQRYRLENIAEQWRQLFESL
jgi:glycosyltransferase involved in cell wall biosynthesis